MFKTAKNKDGNTEKNTDRSFCVPENADGKIHKNAAKHRPYKCSDNGLIFELTATKNLGGYGNGRNCDFYKQRAQNTRERVPEKPCNEIQNIASFMTFGYVADFSRKQVVAF